MVSITQDLRFKQAVIEYSLAHGVTKAAIRYRKTRQRIYYWRRRYNGDIRSLLPMSRRPHSHPRAHTEEEIRLIQNMRKRNPNEGLVMFWVKLLKRNYARSVASLYRVMRRLGYFNKAAKKKPKYKPKPYERFTAIDEFSRQRYLEAFKENSSHSAAIFLQHAIEYFKFPIKCVQTDNGQEFTKYFGHDKRRETDPTLFQRVLCVNGIVHKQIRAYTPRHNGKVERSHRKDNERFYSKHSFYSLADLQEQLKRYNREYNHTPMRPLGWKPPNQYLADYFNNKSVTDV